MAAAKDAPYDPFPFLGIFFETLGPEIEEWVKERTELRQQHIMMMRIRHCKRYCRRNGLIARDILTEMKLLFKDLNAEEQESLAQLIDDELDR